MTPLERTAAEALMRIAAAAEVDLLHNVKGGPLAHILLQARQDAIQALAAMVQVEPTNVVDLRRLQNEVQRFLDLVTYTRKIFEHSDEAEMKLAAEDRDTLRELVGDVAGDEE